MSDNVRQDLDLSVNNLQCIHIVLPEFIAAMSHISALQCQAFSVYALVFSQVASPTLRALILSETKMVEVMDMALLPHVAVVMQFKHMQRVVFLSWSWGLEWL